MREIQDLTLNMVRGLDGIDHQLKGRSSDFKFWLSPNVGSLVEPRVRGVRFTAVPLSPLPPFGRVADSMEDFLGLRDFRATIGASIVGLSFRPMGYNTRSILRGGRYYLEDANDASFRMEVFDNGLVDLWARWPVYQGHPEIIYLSWVLSMAAGVMATLEKCRMRAGAPDMEYALEGEINIAGLVPYGAEVILGPLVDSMLRYVIGNVTVPLIMPRYSIGSEDDFDVVVNLIANDCYDAAGSRMRHAPIEVDFNHKSRQIP